MTERLDTDTRIFRVHTCMHALSFPHHQTNSLTQTSVSDHRGQTGSGDSIFEKSLGKNTSVVHYESRKRELKIRPMNEGRSDERLKAGVEESTCLTYTGFFLVVYYKSKARAKESI